MSESLIQYAFTAGEISPTLTARSDLEKYDLGLSLCYNFFVDYRGGITSRAGTRFIEYIKGTAVRFFRFQFSPDTQNTYLLVIGDGYIRFVQDGGYVVEASVTVTDVTAGTATATAHGYTTGDWVYLDGQVFEVGATTSDTFELLTVWGAAPSADPAAGPANRIYTVPAPWAAGDLQRLVVSQRRDETVFTHPSYAPQKLVRNDAVDWTLSAIDFNSRTAAPTGLSVSSSTSGNAGTIFAVTAVKGGVESPPTRLLKTGIVNYTTTAGWARVVWDSQDVDHFNVYRSLVLSDATTTLTLAQELGYVGRALGPVFTDNNIIPDFTRTPPEHANPFAVAGIASINVTAGGSGYVATDTVIVTDPDGTGFQGYPIVLSGAIVAVVVTSPGSGYTAPVVSFGTSGGSGATATATVGATTGTNPATSRIFQQRRVYGGTDNEPLTLWGSKVAQFDNFDTSSITAADDAYEFTLDAEQVAPIRHLIPMQGGLVIMSEGGVWQLRGAENRAVNPTNAIADPQSYNGCSFVTPITIDTDILYTQEKGAVVRSLAYNDLAKVFAGTDVSTLSNHFFKRGGEIVRWSYSEEPHRLVWGVRANGGLLSFTYVKEQEVYAWAQHWTQGLVKDCLSVVEEDKDYLYLAVCRYIGGRWLFMLERMAQRDFDNIEEFWGVDCGLQTTRTYPDAELAPGAATGTAVSFTASAAVFASGDVGKAIWAGSAKAVITAFVSATEVTCRIDRPFLTLAGTTTPVSHVSGAWSLDPHVTTVTGLGHLEGQTVAILADGSVKSQQVVTDGAVTVSPAASIITVGLPFIAQAQSLPLTASSVVIEGKRKRVVGVAARVHETRGLSFGRDAQSLYETRDRTTEPWGAPTAAYSGVKHVAIEPTWEPDGSIFIQQSYPLPATILGYVLDTEIGDEND